MTALICFGRTKQHAETKGSLNLGKFAYMYRFAVQLACCFRRNFSVLLQKSVTALICQPATRDASVLSQTPRSSIISCCRSHFDFYSESIGVTLAMEDWLAQRLAEIEENRGSRRIRHLAGQLCVLLHSGCCFILRAAFIWRAASLIATPLFACCFILRAASFRVLLHFACCFILRAASSCVLLHLACCFIWPAASRIRFRSCTT